MVPVKHSHSPKTTTPMRLSSHTPDMSSLRATLGAKYLTASTYQMKLPTVTICTAHPIRLTKPQETAITGALRSTGHHRRVFQMWATYNSDPNTVPTMVRSSPTQQVVKLPVIIREIIGRPTRTNTVQLPTMVLP